MDDGDDDYDDDMRITQFLETQTMKNSESEKTQLKLQLLETFQKRID